MNSPNVVTKCSTMCGNAFLVFAPMNSTTKRERVRLSVRKIAYIRSSLKNPLFDGIHTSLIATTYAIDYDILESHADMGFSSVFRVYSMVLF